jgi:hypothetical protein
MVAVMVGVVGTAVIVRLVGAAGVRSAGAAVGARPGTGRRDGAEQGVAFSIAQAVSPFSATVRLVVFPAVSAVYFPPYKPPSRSHTFYMSPVVPKPTWSSPRN